MSVEMVALAAIAPNPYRYIDTYKLSEEKLEALIQSYDTSGFWDGSIQARPHPKKPGKYEIAFGHHRVEAAKRAKLTTLGLVVAHRSNADMLRMMADENREEFRADALVGVETIAAVVDAYERGEIELEPVDPKTNSAHIHALPGGKAYSLTTVAQFLGWVKPSDRQATHRCRVAFDGYLSRATTRTALASIPSAQRSEVALETVTTATRAARKAAEDAGLSPARVQQAERMAAHAAADEVRENSGFKARDVAVSIGHKAVAEVKGKKPRQSVPVEAYIERLKHKIGAVATPYQSLLTQCHMLLPVLDDINPDQRIELADALEHMLTLTTAPVTDLIKALRSNQRARLRKLLEA